MKKPKKHTSTKSLGFKPDVKSSRVTVSSRIANTDKFNQFLHIIDDTPLVKKQISLFCFDNLTSLIDDIKLFQSLYSQFNSNFLNSWELQNIFQEIVSHYHESAKRYLAKANFIVNSNKYYNNSNKPFDLAKLATFINKHSNLKIDDIENRVFHNQDNPNDYNLYLTKIKHYKLDFYIEHTLDNLNHYLNKYQDELNTLNNQIKDNNNIVYYDNLNEKDKQLSILENKIKSYHKLIAQFNEVLQFNLTKPHLYNRLIKLIINKKLRLLSNVKLGLYNTGTHARNFNNGQISIVKDLNNTKYQYFLKVRANNKLSGHTPTSKKTETQQEFEIRLKQYNEDNFIYLPITYNKHRLKYIKKNIEDILSKDNPQILIKSEQLRHNKQSRKIHVIFTYEEVNPLAKVIDESLFNNKDKKVDIKANDKNTLGCDVNMKHNLLADSNGVFYNDILINQSTPTVKTRFIENVEEIVLLHSKPLAIRTEKEIYRYQKLLRINESLIKEYLSSLIKVWKGNDILHIVLEDLNLQNNRSYVTYAGINIKYSRLAKLLRLSSIKEWVASIGEKQGLFTHWVHAAYSSQECSKCHYISNTNRSNQEDFICMNKDCNHRENADTNSARNSKERYINVEIRERLGKDNVYQCHRSHNLYYKRVKLILDDYYENSKKLGHEAKLSNINKAKGRKFGVVTELLPITKEEASSFRAG